MVYKMDYDCGKKIIPAELTVGEAIDLYIDSRDNTVSVSTVRGYRTIRRNCLGALADVKIGKVTEIILQNWANKNAPKYSPKSIRNQFGLITAALNQPELRQRPFKASSENRVQYTRRRKDEGYYFGS